MTNFNRRAVLAGGLAIAGLSGGIPSMAAPVTRTSALKKKVFRPGEIWLDTSGKPIHAHAGSIIVVDDVFYWYGENKERTDGKNGIWHWGVRCYGSRDLYSWEDLGLIIPPEPNDPTSPLYPQKAMDRPHIIYNSETKKFVCWIKVMSGVNQSRAVLTADKITGPYALIVKDLLPDGMSAGDFDIVASADEGKAYMYFERVHTEMICADLSADYTALTGYYSTHFPHGHPPHVREGIAYFKRGEKHYLASSGTTGYFPNPSEVAVGDSYHGPFTVLGDLNPSDRSRTSFNSQISSIFRHPGKKDLYIALADRWLGPQSGAEFEDGTLSALVQSAFDKRFGPTKAPFTTQEKTAFTDGYYYVNTSLARYVWLPVRFEGERPFIDWRDEWSLDEFS